MNTRTLLTIALSSLCTLGWAQDVPKQPVPRVAKPPQPLLTTAEAIEAVKFADSMRIDAMLKSDANLLETFLTKDLVYTHSNGKVDSRDALLDSISSKALIYQKITYTEPVYRAYGNTVVVTGGVSVSVKNPTGEVSFKAVFTAVWSRNRTDWKLNTWQTTRLPDPKSN